MPPEHKFVVDAYAVQHPGADERHARQSVAVHLVRLCLMLERERDVTHATRMITRATTSGIEMKWLDPALPLGTITVQDLLDAPGREAHILKSREWAADLWEAWSSQHELVRAWCDALENGEPGAA